MLNIPNFLTIIRIIGSICLPILLLVDANETGCFFALLIFVFCSLTDFLDGYLARKLNLQTDLEFVDFIRKLCTVGLLDTTISKKGSATVSINEEAAGLFLVFSGNVDLAKTLVTAKS